MQDFIDALEQMNLGLCEKLCECKFESIKKMLSDNEFYGRILKEGYDS